jgi:hypothetical protein
MSIEFVQIADFTGNVVATATVQEQGEYYSGSVNLDRMPKLMRSQFEEFENLINNIVLSSLDRITEEINIHQFTVIFDNDRRFAIDDLQIYPKEEIISFKRLTLIS